MSQVLKYTLGSARTTLWFHDGSIPLAVGWQGLDLQMWVQHSQDHAGPVKPRNFLAVGTGETFPDNQKRVFIGTAISDDVVIHVFEEIQ